MKDDPSFDDNSTDKADGEAAEDVGNGGPYGISGDGDLADVPAGEPSEVLSEAERILDERNSYLDALQRLQADFDNFRKRAQRQQLESKELANSQLIEKLLPVLDAFELALNHMDPDAFVREKLDSETEPKGTAVKGDGSEGKTSTEVKGEFVKPFIQIGSLLENILQKEGLTKIGQSGEQFNPAYHDAVSHEEADAPEEAGIITAVLRSGYQFKEKVLRPAMVKVKG